MKKYNRITKKERQKIEMYVKERLSIRSIARLIDRPAKTVSEEIRRNGGYLGYYAEKAHAKVKSNKKGYSKIAANQALAMYIQEKLNIRWSPEVISGRWNRENKHLKISTEAIYQWIYSQSNDLYLSLARKKKKRGLRPQRNRSKIPNRTSIHDRPEHINNRSQVGHYEADLVFQEGNKSQNIVTVIERKSRKIMLRKNQSKHAKVVIDALNNVKLKNKYPMISCTFDNGLEFADHVKLAVDTYFCDPGAPWQKGAVENANGILRLYIDSTIDANDITQEMLDHVEVLINNKPRKILNFLTPNEVIANLYKQNLECVTF